MNLPDPIIQRIIDRMVGGPLSFALYRLPWTDEPVLILQEKGSPEVFTTPCELNGKRGFVLTPFQATDAHPALLIRDDRTGRDWQEIEEALAPYAEAYRAGEWPATTADLSDRPREEVDTVTEKASYFLSFHRFITPLQQREFHKLVLSRSTSCELPKDFSPLAAFIRACNSYPRMMVTLCYTPLTGTWMGSTPEIILSGHERQWSTVALAGTMPLDGDGLPDEWSKKNREEQAFVAEYVRRILKKRAGKIDEKGPYTARAGSLVHLKTDFRFCLKDALHLGDLLEELHPTPAVCGLPKQEAYDFILQNEGHDRRYYSGIIGWLDPEGDTHLYVNLRCMELHPHSATLYAGGGILPTSTAETEWEETNEKLKTMKRLTDS